MHQRVANSWHKNFSEQHAYDILTGAHTNTINKHAMCHSHWETFCTNPAPPSPLWQTYRKEEIRSEQSSGEDVSPQEGQPERDKNKRRRDRNKMRLQRKRLRSAKQGGKHLHKENLSEYLMMFLIQVCFLKEPMALIPYFRHMSSLFLLLLVYSRIFPYFWSEYLK